MWTSYMYFQFPSYIHGIRRLEDVVDSNLRPIYALCPGDL